MSIWKTIATAVIGGEVDAPSGAKLLRVVAEVNGQFSPEESAPLQRDVDDSGVGGYKPSREPLKPDAPAVMTSRFEPKETAAAFSALDRLSKIPEARVLGGMVEVNGVRAEGDFLTLRLGRDVPLAATDLDRMVKELTGLLGAETPTVKLRLDSIAFPSGRDLTRFWDESGEDFDRLDWKQD